MTRIGIAAGIVAGVVAVAPAAALDETGAHSVLKHDLIDTIVFESKVARVVDLFGGQIVYTSEKTNAVEVGAAGRLISNGYASEYVINDQLYTSTAGAGCKVANLPDQVRPVTVRINAVTFADEKAGFGKEAVGYLSKLPVVKDRQIVLIDPYFFAYVDAIKYILDNTEDVGLLIFSPGDRMTRFPFPEKECQSLVYSETNPDFKKILKNTRTGAESTYTLTGCRIDPKAWQAGVTSTLKQLSAGIKQESPNRVLIRTDFRPQDFDKYLEGAQAVRACIIDGKGPFFAK